MPKSKKRKKAVAGRVSGGSQAGSLAIQANSTRQGATRRQPARATSWLRTPGMQGLAFAVLLSLGFWGFTVFFLAFYTEDANHYLYAAIAGVTALGWTLILVRRWLALRRQTGVR